MPWWDGRAWHMTPMTVDDDLALACSEGNLDALKQYKDEGGDLTVKTEYGITCVCIAAATGQVEVVRFLLVAGCPVDCRGQISSWTPLMRAAARGSVECVTTLLQAGADPMLTGGDDTRGNKDLTAEDWAEHKGGKLGAEIASIIRQHIAKQQAHAQGHGVQQPAHALNEGDPIGTVAPSAAAHGEAKAAQQARTEKFSTPTTGAASAAAQLEAEAEAEPELEPEAPLTYMPKLGDQVQARTGVDAGKIGKVIQLFPEKGKNGKIKVRFASGDGRTNDIRLYATVAEPEPEPEQAPESTPKEIPDRVRGLGK